MIKEVYSTLKAAVNNNRYLEEKFYTIAKNRILNKEIKLKTTEETVATVIIEALLSLEQSQPSKKVFFKMAREYKSIGCGSLAYLIHSLCDSFIHPILWAINDIANIVRFAKDKSFYNALMQVKELHGNKITFASGYLRLMESNLKEIETAVILALWCLLHGQELTGESNTATITKALHGASECHERMEYIFPDFTEKLWVLSRNIANVYWVEDNTLIKYAGSKDILTLEYDITHIARNAINKQLKKLKLAYVVDLPEDINKPRIIIGYSNSFPEKFCRKNGIRFVSYQKYNKYLLGYITGSELFLSEGE